MGKPKFLHNFISNLPFLILAALSLVLVSFGSLYDIPKGLWAVPAVLVLVSALYCPRLLSRKTHTTGTIWIGGVLSFLLALLSALDLYFEMPNGIYWRRYFVVHPDSQTPILWVLSIALGVCVFFTLFALLSHLPQSLSCRFSENQPVPLSQNPKKETVCLFLYSALVAFVVLTVCTKSSFLYPLNDWVDANCFFTVGKVLTNGKVLYRDIYEQKGPWLYFLHALCYRLSEKSFFGVYLLELFAGTFFLYFSAKILRVYRVRGVYVLLPLLASAVYASYAFCYGDSVEELCLPLFAAAMYIAERAFSENRSISLRGWLCVGVLAGLVFWMKFNLVGFFIGWALVPLWKTLRKDGFGALIKAVLCILTGVLLPSIPVLAYFGSVGAFSDLWQAYFYNNLFLYADKGEKALGVAAFSERLLWRIGNTVEKNVYFAVPAFAGVVWYTVSAEKGRRAHLLCSAVVTLLFVFSGDVSYPYYSLVFAVFTVFAAVALGKIARRVSRKEVKQFVTVCAAVVTLCGAGLFSYFTSDNTYLMVYQKDELPQYKFQKIICSVENPTLLNYGFLDGGFYTTTGIVPESKYFCRLNIPLPEMVVSQSLEVYHQKTDFVVTRDKTLKNSNYICVASATQYFEGTDYTYYLYAAERVLPILAENGVLTEAEIAANDSQKQ